MQYLNRLWVVLVLLVLLLVGSVAAVQAQDETGTVPDVGESPPVIVIDSGGDEQSSQYVLLLGLGMFAVIVITGLLGPQWALMAVQAGGLVAGKTKTTMDDNLIIDLAMRNGWTWTRAADGSIRVEKPTDIDLSPHPPDPRNTGSFPTSGDGQLVEAPDK